MSHDLRLLGLPRDATTRDIKRAYARLLKATRPDGDARAFQRLHEAYERALAAATRREAHPAIDDIDDIDHDPAGEELSADVEPLQSAHAPHGDAHADHHRLLDGADATPAPPAPRVFHLGPFVDALEERLGHGGTRLLEWLRADPVLWDVQVKQAVAGPLVQALAERGAIVAHEELEALATFFGLDIHGLRRLGMLEAWTHLLDTAEALGLADRHGPGREERWLEALARRELMGPPDAGRRWLLKLLPLAPGRVAALRADILERLGDAGGRHLDDDAQAYWRDAGDTRRYAPARLALGALRLLALVATALLVAVALPSGPDAAPLQARLATALWLSGGIAAGWATLGGAYALMATTHRALDARGLPRTLWTVGLMVALMLVALAAGSDGERLAAGLFGGAVALGRVAIRRLGPAIVLAIGSLLLVASVLGPWLPGDVPKAGLTVLLAGLLAPAALLASDLRQARRERRPLNTLRPGEHDRRSWRLAFGSVVLGVAIGAAWLALT